MVRLINILKLKHIRKILKINIVVWCSAKKSGSKRSFKSLKEKKLLKWCKSDQKRIIKEIDTKRQEIKMHGSESAPVIDEKQRTIILQNVSDVKFKEFQ